LVYIILSIIIAIVSIILILAVLFQESKSYGLSAGISGGSDTYWSRNKSRSKQGRLVKITTIAGIAFFIIAILLNVGFLTNL